MVSLTLAGEESVFRAAMRKNYSSENGFGRLTARPRAVPANVKMQSTINLAITNACTQLDLPPTFAMAVIAHIWRTAPPPPPPPTAPANLEKLNRQQVQKLEELADLAGDTTDEKILHRMFLSRINDMVPEYFKSKSLIDHMRVFFNLDDAPPSNAAFGAGPAVVAAQPPPIDDDDEDVVDVNFHLREYSVGIKTHRVYEMRGGVHVFVGMLGMNEFKGMVMPEIED